MSASAAMVISIIAAACIVILIAVDVYRCIRNISGLSRQNPGNYLLWCL